MATLYYISTRPESRWTQDHAAAGYSPVLNDETGKGDTVHKDFEPAWKLAQDLAYGLEGARGMDVIELTFDDALFLSLKESGDIVDGSLKDMFGAPLVVLSHRACQAINHACTASKKEFLIPEEHLAFMLGAADHRSSGVMH